MQNIGPDNAIRANSNTGEMILLGNTDSEGRRPFIAIAEDDFEPVNLDWFRNDQAAHDALEEYPDKVEPTLGMVQTLRSELDRELDDILLEGTDTLRGRYSTNPTSFPFHDSDRAHQEAELMTHNLNGIRLLAEHLNVIEARLKKDAAA